MGRSNTTLSGQKSKHCIPGAFPGKKELYPRCRQVIQDRGSGRQAGDSGSNIWQAGRQVIQDRISGRQVGGADEYLIEYLVGRQVI